MVFKMFKRFVSLYCLGGCVCNFWYSNNFVSWGYGGLSIREFSYDYAIISSHGVNIGHHGPILCRSEKVCDTLKLPWNER